ncbi:DUF2975 domain-containing protein [Chitinophaga agrisoli]|nr:DUF2975 domain-containing protein [Chitinophaga agrisoli]
MNRYILLTLKVIVDTGWYLILPLMLIVAIVIGIQVATAGRLEWDVPVVLKTDHLPVETIDAADFHATKIVKTEGVLKLDVKLTPFLTADAVLFFCLGVSLLVGILRNAREIIASLQADAPFDLANVRRLRIIGLCVLGNALLECCNSLLNIFLFNKHIREMENMYQVKVVFGMNAIIVGLVILLLSEIFRKGAQLKADNESFV